MDTYQINLAVKLELEAYTVEDAKELAEEAIRDLEGLGIVVHEVNVVSAIKA